MSQDIYRVQKDRQKNARKTQVHTPKPLKEERPPGHWEDWFEEQVDELERHGDREERG